MHVMEDFISYVMQRGYTHDMALCLYYYLKVIVDFGAAAKLKELPRYALSSQFVQAVKPPPVLFAPTAETAPKIFDPTIYRLPVSMQQFGFTKSLAPTLAYAYDPFSQTLLVWVEPREADDECVRS